MDKRIKKNILFNFLTQFITLAVPFALSIYVSRVLDVQLIGRYSYVQSILTYFTIIANFGVTTYGVVRISGCKHDREMQKKAYWELFLIKGVTSLISAAAYLVLTILYKDYTLLFSFGFLSIAGCLFDVSWYYQGRENFLVVTLAIIIPKTLQLILTILFVKSPENFNLYVLLAFGTIFVSGFALFIPASISCKNPGKLDFKPHIKPSAQMFASAALVSIYTVMDRSMIQWITQDEKEVGFYEQAFKVFNISSALVTVVAQVLSPRVAKVKDEGFEQLDSLFMSGFKSSFIFSFPMFVGMLVLAATIINGLFGSGYEQSIPILMVFSVLPVVVGVGRLLVYIYINPFYKQKFSVYATIVGALTNLVLNVVLCYFLKALGTAIATLISEIVVATMNLLYFRKSYKIGRYLASCWKYALAAAIMGAATYCMNRWLPIGNAVYLLLIIIPTSAIVYFLVLIALKEDMCWGIIRKVFHRKEANGN